MILLIQSSNTFNRNIEVNSIMNRIKDCTFDNSMMTRIRMTPVLQYIDNHDLI